MFLLLTDNYKILNSIDLMNKTLYHSINQFALNHNIFKNLNCENVSILKKPHKVVLILVQENKH